MSNKYHKRTLHAVDSEISAEFKDLYKMNLKFTRHLLNICHFFYWCYKYLQII